jgi:hypothetical protein
MLAGLRGAESQNRRQVYGTRRTRPSVRPRRGSEIVGANSTCSLREHFNREVASTEPLNRQGYAAVDFAAPCRRRREHAGLPRVDGRWKHTRFAWPWHRPAGRTGVRAMSRAPGITCRRFRTHAALPPVIGRATRARLAGPGRRRRSPARWASAPAHPESLRPYLAGAALRRHVRAVPDCCRYCLTDVPGRPWPRFGACRSAVLDARRFAARARAHGARTRRFASENSGAPTRKRRAPRVQDLQITTCGSLWFLPCVPVHSALVPNMHCTGLEKASILITNNREAAR